MEENKKIVIAIDGPGAAGKSTVAKKLAKKLNYTYIDTGAMYRCLALYVLNNHIDAYNKDELVKATNKINIFMNENGNIYLDGNDVTSDIRTNEVSKLASLVSCPKEVRELFVLKQRELANASKNGVVMDGRDIGTVVLPDANLKIYQIADANVRALRRYNENVSKGITTPYETILKEIQERDYMDMNKGFGALKKANDSIELDTTNLTIDEAVSKIYEKVLEIQSK